MKQLFKVWQYKRKAAQSMYKASRTSGHENTYWYQRYIYYTNKLEEMN